MMDWIFVGDAHFGLGDGSRRDRFIRFIQRNKPSLNTLVIMGDLFDFWFGFRNLSPLRRKYGDILDLLEEIRGEGIKVIYLEGNHDFRLGPYMSEKLGIQVYNRSAQLDLDGNRMYLAHGDMAYPKLSHRIFSFLLKNRLAYRLMSWLGPQVVMGIATWLSSGSRRRGLEERPETISRLRKFALHKLDEGFDAVILAHSHVPEEMAVERGGGMGYYFNVGNWMSDFS
ncbi:MAG: UDP-2,3-diacylglucosamine diphosphatase, partial [Deltaproteobacteria bacterium]